MKSDLKVRYMSDIHIEQYQRENKNVSDMVEPHEDDINSVLILAGDNFHLPDIEAKRWLNNIKVALSNLSERFREVIMVMGNHEYYSNDIMEYVHITFDGIVSGFDNVTLLVGDDTVIVDDYVFMGNTLWTDLKTTFPTDKVPTNIKNAGVTGLADCSVIKRNGYVLEPQDMAEMFHNNIKSIEDNLIIHKDKVKVVVTHHAPSEKSSLPKFTGTLLNSYFKSDLEDFIKEHRPDVWVHGHMHNSSKYMIGSTLILCEPVGYGKGLENMQKNRQAYFILTKDGVNYDNL